MDCSLLLSLSFFKDFFFFFFFFTFNLLLSNFLLLLLGFIVVVCGVGHITKNSTNVLSACRKRRLKETGRGDWESPPL